MNVVVFLGAGFSAAFGLPVMNGFFDSASQSPRLTPEEKDFIRDIRISARNAMGTISIQETNLEDVLSFATAGNSGTTSNGENSASFSMKTILAKIYGPRPQDFNENVLPQMFNPFFGLNEQMSREQLTVITTNYDVIAELGFATCGRKLALPFEYESTNQKSSIIYAHTESASVLCKIHGSANWFEGADGVHVEDALLSGFRMLKGGETEDAHWPRVWDQEYQMPKRPLIVPPTVFKAHGSEPITASLARAHESLAIADRVVFVGYSFPDSDAYMRYFLASALAKNLELRDIAIVDPAAIEIAERLRSPVARYGSLFMDKLEPVPLKWQQYEWSVFDDFRY